MFHERQESCLIISPIEIGTELNTNLSAVLEGPSGQIVLVRLCQTKQCDKGFPGAERQRTCQFRRRRCDPWIRKIPWRRKWQPTPVFLLGKFHEQRRLAGYDP